MQFSFVVDHPFDRSARWTEVVYGDLFNAVVDLDDIGYRFTQYARGLAGGQGLCGFIEQDDIALHINRNDRIGNTREYEPQFVAFGRRYLLFGAERCDRFRERIGSRIEASRQVADLVGRFDARPIFEIALSKFDRSGMQCFYRPGNSAGEENGCTCRSEHCSKREEYGEPCGATRLAIDRILRLFSYDEPVDARWRGSAQIVQLDRHRVRRAENVIPLLVGVCRRHLFCVARILDDAEHGRKRRKIALREHV